MVSECMCLYNNVKTFFKLSEEMELSLMFPSMLKDVSIQSINGVELFKEDFADCSDLFRTIISLKDEILFGLKKNWYGENNKPSKNQDLAPKFRHTVDVLVEATTLAKLLHNKYHTKINEKESGTEIIDIANIDRIERVVENLNFLGVVERFQEEMKELEAVVLIPCLLQDVLDADMNAYLKKSSLGITKDFSLLEVFQFLKNIKNILLVAPNRQVIYNNDNRIASDLNELHSIISNLVHICLCIMQTYQEELAKSTGSYENIWNTNMNKNNEAEGTNIFYINRDINPTQYQLSY